jgi:hypothetical protein
VGSVTCTLVPERSRVTGEALPVLDVSWSANGCANGRTQYGRDGGAWSRVFVPADEAAVSINRYDPGTNEFVVERYLLGSEAMSQARAARAEFEAPSCGASDDQARAFGAEQGGLAALLPANPNERLVYSCRPAG